MVPASGSGHKNGTGRTITPKYSVKQKRLAVDHYLDHGRCMTVTIKALGYPGRDSLTSWIDELLPDATKRLVGIPIITPAEAMVRIGGANLKT